MVNIRKMIGITIIALSTLILSACGGSEVDSGEQIAACDVPNIYDSATQRCVAPPPIICVAPEVPNSANDACEVGYNPELADPVFTPSADQAVLYFNRNAVDADNSPNDPAYNGYKLHTWNNDECAAYVDADTAWTDGRVHNGIDPVYGAYWILDLIPGYADTPGACHNFIIHIGTDDSGKEMGGGDFKGKLTQEDERFARMNFVFSGNSAIYEFPVDALGEQPVSVEGSQAHWLDSQTILWAVDDALVDSVKLHYSDSANIEITLEDGVLNSTSVELTEVDLSTEQQEIAPHLNGITAFAGDWSEDDAKAVLKTQAILGAYNDEGKLVAATRMQIGNVIDELYTKGDADADEAALGPIYTDAGITAAVWAPTAQNVNLNIYNSGKSLDTSYPMNYDAASGVWSYEGGMELDRQLYRYEVSVYSPVSDEIEVLDVTDPYSVSLSTNGRFSQFVNLNDDDLKPDGWDSHIIPTVENFEDIVIYEGHIRNFSVRDESTSEANRGKYLAFTEQDSVPMTHLKNLQEAGLTHFHMLPANDIATINEDPNRTIEWTSTIAQFCAIAPAASVCTDGTSTSMTIAQVFESFSTVTEGGAAQAFAEELRNYDLFNWGYDPKHFNTPEGSYSTDADSTARILEMRAMNQSLHEIGLRVALDVVYNHTNASGLFANSVFDKVVPGYYHRYDIETGDIIRETCCDDTEPRNRMMEKFMEDSLLMWSEHYKFDAFRFDIMSQASKTTMVALFESVKAIDEDVYFYGEGWGKDTAAYGDFEIASQFNMAGTEIGTYNDRIREAIRQGLIFSEESSEASLDAQDKVKMSMAGTLTDFVLKTSGGSDAQTSVLGGYATDPADIINYVSKHDNETLWDQFNYVLPSSYSLEQRVRAQNIGIGIPLMSQGIPFLQMGGDFLRSKSMDRNTYDSGDWFNYVDFTMQTNNFNVGLPLAGDNEARWDEIANFMNSVDRAAGMHEIEFAAEVFQELLSIRSSSRLFRLTTSDEIKQRVGFHNIGARQEFGMIAMSIDDGINTEGATMLEDLDSSTDALMVVVNSSTEEKSIEVRTAEGFELYSTLMNSIDPVVRGASFSDTSADGVTQGTFTVPALTIAVFTKPQGTQRAYGLSAIATAGAPDVVPYGDSPVYVRGDMNGWGLDNAFTYKGEGVYEATIQLTSGINYGFKVATEDWSTANLGNNDDPIVVEDIAKTLNPGGGNMSISVSSDASYVFTLDASDTAAPILTVVNEEPYVGTPVYIRGSMNSWGTDNELEYQGGRIYHSEGIFIPAGEHLFKVASEDWSTVNLGGVSADATDITVTLGNNQYLAASNNNLALDIQEAGNYVFIFDTVDLNEPKIRVFKEEFFGNSAVYIRGSMNGWGAVDQLSYQGNGEYSVNITLDGGAVNFKVADADWANINLGALSGDDNVISVNQAFELYADGSSADISIQPAPAAGDYKFTIKGPDAKAPEVIVTPVN
ncbi:alpha-1,6-glucosidase domain-containing protein [Glaciecola sp. 2405UD65-10]|uniref:alpha-1,6-glucosidase domain-containing protein n=1 Tax=Glaciecola sp. 2405UD65-10 TaxID=3397244 RepID=UPI003B5CB6D8